MILTLALAALPLQTTISVQPDPNRDPVTVHLPAGISSADPRPLIIALHANGTVGARIEASLQYLSFQASEDFIYCFPTGTLIDPNVPTRAFWDASPACCNQSGTPVDDVTFIMDLVDAIEAQTHVNPRRVHLIGESNGGFLAQEVARQHSDEIASIVSINGSMATASSTFPFADPVHVLHINGDADGVVPPGGGTWNGFAPFLGAAALTDRWAAHNGCTASSTTSSAVLNLDAGLPVGTGDANDATRTTYTNCDNGGTVERWTVLGGGHLLNMTQELRIETLAFLLERPAPGVESTTFCSPAAANSQGSIGLIAATGSDAIVDNGLTLGVSGLIPSEFGMFVASNSTTAPVSGLCLGSPIHRMTNHVFQMDTFGAASVNVDLGPIGAAITVMPGTTVFFQSWSRDTAAPAGQQFQYSDGVGVLLH